MLRIRKSQERGHGDHGWLDTRHTFSFADYYDPAHTGFRSLRVMNEDRVAPGQGFGRHPHRDMEILSYVLEGVLEHRDSLGTGAVIRPGELQRITAGTGVWHSEYNPSVGEAVHFYQVWLLPETKGLPPGYEQKRFGREGRLGQFQRVASPDGRDGSLTVRQDADVYLAELNENALVHKLRSGRHAWVQVVRGNVLVNGASLSAGDGAAISDESTLTLGPSGPGEVMLFDLA
jgi:redox-sensitive bicupin YhaK (pirin superfamily)